MTGIDEGLKFSENKLQQIRTKLAGVIPDGQLVVTCGSYARREASSSSDMDYYSILPGRSGSITVPPWDAALRTAVLEIVGKLPSKKGAFAKNIGEQELLKNFGGSRDSNGSITRRMLYLLEGEYLTCPDKFYEIRTKIIEKYVNHTPRDHQLAFYLLNDIIRYWRTLAVDYADKTYAARKPKPWAVRNIKLVFSRKLIYASGLFSVALTADRATHEKIKILNFMFDKTPLERLRYVSGGVATERLFQMYSYFLEEISKENVRIHLDSLTEAQGKSDPLFRKLKNEGHYFSRELMGLFSKTFHSSHPIHMGVVF